MKITKRQIKRIIREEKNKLIAETRLRRTVRKALREQAGGGLIKYGSVAEVMAGIADYYRAEYGPEADDFIQGNPTIRDFLFNDEFAVEEGVFFALLEVGGFFATMQSARGSHLPLHGAGENARPSESAGLFL